MKKLATLVLAMLLMGTLSFAQAGGSTSSQDTTKSDTGKKSKKAKKGGKKSKKGSTGDTTSTPK